MAELVTATGASELEVAARLVELGMAATTIEVAGRLGCEAGATLDVRVRMAADRAAAAVWVLVADGLRGTERARALDRDHAPKAYRHVSLHAHAADAREALDRLLAGYLGRDGSSEEVSVTLAQRTVGDLAIGDTLHKHPPRALHPGRSKLNHRRQTATPGRWPLTSHGCGGPGRGTGRTDPLVIVKKPTFPEDRERSPLRGRGTVKNSFNKRRGSTTRPHRLLRRSGA